MNLIETRGNENGNPKSVKFSEAILSPMASFGGLYAPDKLPDFGLEFIKKHLNSSYKELAKDVLTSFNIDIQESLIDEALNRYDHFDDSNNPVPVVKVKDDLYVSELYHGPTRAFKDMALQPFGTILSKIAQDRGENYLIMAATSGDTGPATLETFKNKNNIKVACLYPSGGTSDVQRLQMVTEDAPNLEVLGIKGNFDDAQAALKSLLSSDEFNQTLKNLNIKLSAANSVNFGRIIFQTIYHIHSYLELLRSDAISLGDKIYLVVPSGNFGNALGAYYVKKAGVPIEKILISSNSNNVLTELINNGKYDLRDKKLINTNSPAMDILKSSNVERVLFDKFGSKRTKELMESLNSNNYYQLNDNELEALREDFDAIYTTDKEALEIIKEYLENGYLLDPHTATCVKAYNKLKKENIPTVIYSTAEWTKFSPTIAKAVGYEAKDDKDALSFISKKFNKEINEKIASLFNKMTVHNKVIEKYDIMNSIKLFLEK